MPTKRDNQHYQYLVKKWTQRHRDLQDKIFTDHGDSFKWLQENSKQFVIGSLAGIMLLTSPILDKIPQSFSSASAQAIETIDKKVFLSYDLRKVLPSEVRALTPDEEKDVSQILTRNFGFSIQAELEGKRLNTTYGIIGAEQHLARFPGDSMFSHFGSEDDAQEYWSSGMAPGLGAWRYFTDASDASGELTQKDIDREKYYIAVQTFLAPGFDSNPKEYTDFFKYRKMLVVNPQNGKAIVADIADAGPSPWTGKQLGGSPEVMSYLERFDGAQKGAVLYFFIDDPSDTIPLGPINL